MPFGVKGNGWASAKQRRDHHGVVLNWPTTHVSLIPFYQKSENDDSTTDHLLRNKVRQKPIWFQCRFEMTCLYQKKMQHICASLPRYELHTTKHFINHEATGFYVSRILRYNSQPTGQKGRLGWSHTGLHNFYILQNGLYYLVSCIGNCTGV